jgi:hypothetical protein
VSRDWVKLYVGILDDPRFGSLSPAAGWAWVRMLALAGRNDDGGRLGSLDQIAWVLHETPEAVGAAVAELGGWITERDGQLYVRDWSEWQPASSTERWRKHAQTDTNAGQREQTPPTPANAGKREPTAPTRTNADQRTRARAEEKRVEEKRIEESTTTLRGAADASPHAASGNGHKPTVEELRRHREALFAAICEACGYDTKLLAGNDSVNVAKLANALLYEQPPWEPEEVRAAGDEWASVRWRSKAKGDIRPPTVAQLRTWLGECKVRWGADSIFDEAVRR